MIKNGFRLLTALLVASLGMGCTTAYDYYGRPRQVIEPGAAIVGAAAIGLLAYGLASSGDHREHHGPRYQSEGYGHGHGHYYEPAPCDY